MRPILFSTLLAAGFAVAALPARAQEDPNAPHLRERLSTLYKLEISQDLCKFDLSDDQSEAIGRQTNDIEDKLGMSEEDSTKLYRQLEGEMKSQKQSVLCNPKGDWAKTYKDELAKLEN